MKKKTKLELLLFLIQQRREIEHEIIMNEADQHNFGKAHYHDGIVHGLFIAEHIIKEEIKLSRNKKINYGGLL